MDTYTHIEYTVPTVKIMEFRRAFNSCIFCVSLEHTKYYCKLASNNSHYFSESS